MSLAVRDAALLEPVLGIAQEAGRRIMEVYGSEFAVTHKDDTSPLTQADLAAHDHIVRALSALDAAIPVLSEESAEIPYAERRAWARYWLVDPLDGTKEFIKRNGEFTVNIALIERGEPVLGVVYAPALELTYLGARGHGAERIKDGRRERITTRRTPARPALVVTKSHRDETLDVLLAKLPAHDAVSKGSSLKFCLVAEGAADFYPRTGPTSEWDTGAGQAVAEAAGARVVRLPDFAPLAYNQKESLLNPGFLVIGEPGYGWEKHLA
ncbi:MAG TPA: 3'(2'),5'-bisphosphate nucleotidase CysQ [Nevskiaceae bacterium]|nr:3'(2'),5'-bisphosphate nucleotidase CysQ [Nevskiaceae bacterium]